MENKTPLRLNGPLLQITVGTLFYFSHSEKCESRLASMKQMCCFVNALLTKNRPNSQRFRCNANFKFL